MFARRIAWIWCLAASLCAVGCAQTRLAHEPGLVSRWDRKPFPAMDQPPAISLILHTRYLMFDEPSDAYIGKWWSKHKIREQLNDVMGEFPFLGRAQWDADDSPVRLVIEATHAIRGSSLRGRLSRMSYSLIPTSERGVVELDARLYRDEGLLKTYEAVGSYTIKRHLIFLALPMMWGYRVPSRTMEDTFRDLLLQVQQDAAGLFSAG